MKTQAPELCFDVVAACGTSWSEDRVNEFRDGVAAIVKWVQHDIRVDYPYVRLQPRYLPSEQTSVLRGEAVRNAVAILDVTNSDAQLLLFAGRLQGAGIAHVIVCRMDWETEARQLGFGTTSLLTYRSLNQLFQPASPLHQELLRAVPPTRIHEELVYQFWFPRGTSTIWVVCPQIHEPGEFADRSSPDYTYLDNLGDTDALLEVMVFLSRYYPSATIERFTSSDLPDGHTSSNLVIIGGPGSAEISNAICKEMMSEMNSHVTYSSDCEQMRVVGPSRETVELRAEYRANGEGGGKQTLLGLRTDWGYFARFKNPLNENATVVLINGIHTAGVLGAARAFSERREALENFRVAIASGVDPAAFECYFTVRMVNGQVTVPVVDPRNVMTLGRAELATTSAQASGLSPASVSERRPTVRILFIAGDRGGSQINQLQIPREYHAIQDSLRASRHRDVMYLANPILGATRGRLAFAYRERPTVVHFAGHGDDRSLSIIEDHGLLANDAPLDANQFSDVLRAMPQRVRLCVLNVCASTDLARHLVDQGVVECALGWPATVSDSDAIAFTTAFYEALGDGRSIGDAASIARVACGLVNVPVLMAAGGSCSEVLVVDDLGDE